MPSTIVLRIIPKSDSIRRQRCRMECLAMASANPMLTDNQSDHPEPLVVSTATDINGSVSTDTVVQKKLLIAYSWKPCRQFDD
jgi:hypothetical protein